MKVELTERIAAFLTLFPIDAICALLKDALLQYKNDKYYYKLVDIEEHPSGMHALEMIAIRRESKKMDKPRSVHRMRTHDGDEMCTCAIHIFKHLAQPYYIEE